MAVGAGTVVIVAVFVSLAPAGLVTAHVNVIVAVVAAVNVIAFVAAPAVIVPPALIDHEYERPAADGAEAESPAFPAVTVPAAVIAQFGVGYDCTVVDEVAATPAPFVTVTVRAIGPGGPAVNVI